MVVVESDRYEENYELISSSQCIILNKISAAKNTVFLVKLVPCRCRSQPYVLQKKKSKSRCTLLFSNFLGCEFDSYDQISLASLVGIHDKRWPFPLLVVVVCKSEASKENCKLAFEIMT